MLKDRYQNPLTTGSEVTCDVYVDGVDRLLAADVGVKQAFQRAIAADDGFALGHAALARAWQISTKGAEAAEAMKQAQALASTTTRREQGHIAILGHLVGGDGRAAHAVALDHLDDFPRDAVIAQPLSSVFGLIGFSGLAGREAEQLAFMNRLAPHCGDDWWFTTQFAFAQIEVGQAERGYGPSKACVMAIRVAPIGPMSARIFTTEPARPSLACAICGTGRGITPARARCNSISAGMSRSGARGWTTPRRAGRSSTRMSVSARLGATD